MDASLSEFDRQQTIGQLGLRDQAIQAGAYGGGREGVMQAEYMNQGAVNRAQLQAQLLNQGFQQAQAAEQRTSSKTRSRSISICARSTTTSCRTSRI